MELRDEISVKPNACPSCGAKLDSVSQVADDGTTESAGGPKCGDVTICISCCSVLRFGENLELILVEDLDKISSGEMKKIEIVKRCLNRIIVGAN